MATLVLVSEHIAPSDVVGETEVKPFAPECLDCFGRELDRNGRCARCGSDAVCG
jgi:hypothetical protein